MERFQADLSALSIKLPAVENRASKMQHNITRNAGDIDNNV